MRALLVTSFLLLGCGMPPPAPADAGQRADPPLTSYSNCRGGCPDTHHCIGWFEQRYCTRKCTTDADCITGCCAETSSGVRACGPELSCSSRCQWGSLNMCVSATTRPAVGCDGGTGMRREYEVTCNNSLHIYSCITDRTGTWDCRLDGTDGGVRQGQVFVHQFCQSGGSYHWWADSASRVEDTQCHFPLPVPP